MRVFSFLNAKTKTEGGESYLQFGASIKMQIVGNHFSALTTEALSLQRPKTPRRMDPLETTTQNFFIFKPKHRRERRRGFLSFFLAASAAFLLRWCVFVLCRSSTGADVRLTSWRMCHCWREERVKVCQSIRRYKASLRKKSRGDRCVEEKKKKRLEHFINERGNIFNQKGSSC